MALLRSAIWVVLRAINIALLRSEEVTPLKKGLSSSKVGHLTGSITINSSKLDLGGAAAKEHSRCRTPMSIAWRATMPITKSIIASGRMQKRLRCLRRSMVWNGGPRETIEMVPWVRGDAEPQPKGWGE